jgi:hypothetical protein
MDRGLCIADDLVCFNCASKPPAPAVPVAALRALKRWPVLLNMECVECVETTDLDALIAAAVAESEARRG